MSQVTFQTKMIEVHIVGTSPLLQSRFTDAAEVEGDKATRTMLAVSGDRRAIAEAGAYRHSDATYYHPGAAVLRLLREAGSNHKLKASRKSAKFIIPSAVLITDDRITLRDPESMAALAAFEVDSRSVVNQKTRGRIMCHRARWDNWAASFQLEVNMSLLPEEFVHQLMQEGGQQIGIGAFRPEKGGPFGRFRVTHWAAAKHEPIAAE